MNPPEATLAGQRLHRRSFSWLGYVLYGVVALRVFILMTASANPLVVAGLLAAILLLLLSDPILFYRFPAFRWLYFPLQAILIPLVGLLPPYQDIWGLLYVVICTQAYVYLPRRRAVGVGLVSVFSFLATLVFTLGASVGLALGVTILAGSAMLVSAEIVYKQLEVSRRESQRLLNEQREASQKLQEYTAQMQAMAAVEERDRLARELHDSVSQTIFSISLMVQAIRILAEKDPSQVPPQLDSLQVLTGSALAQMRSLIWEWRPPTLP
jgi:signal transduction histidine kinase